MLNGFKRIVPCHRTRSISEKTAINLKNERFAFLFFYQTAVDKDNPITPGEGYKKAGDQMAETEEKRRKDKPMTCKDEMMSLTWYIMDRRLQVK